MITYSLETVRKTIEEVCGKFTMTRNLVIKDIGYRKDKKIYIVVLSDGSKHFLPRDLINKYIESLGDFGGLEIAGLLLHAVDLEQSFESWVARTSIAMDDYWAGDMSDVKDYLDEKEKRRQEREKRERGPN